MFFPTSLLTALLVACTVASPVASSDGSATLLPRNGKTLIGYRTVSEKEARSINGVGWLYWDETKMPAGSTIAGQFGVGKSLADRAGEWPSLQPGAPWYCYVLADTAAFAAAKKVELPVPAGDWTEANTAEAIKAIPSAALWDTTRVLRFGLCGNVNELLIPEHMLGYSTKAGGSGPLGLETHCYSSIKKMQKAMKKEAYGEGPAVNFATFSPTAAKRGLELEARGRKAKICQLR